MKKVLKNIKSNCRGDYQSTAGIALVSLVVTIIVILILAGMSISLTIGNNGLFSRAKNAAEKYEFAQKNEIKDLENFYNKIESKLSNKRNITTGEIKMELSVGDRKDAYVAVGLASAWRVDAIMEITEIKLIT